MAILYKRRVISLNILANAIKNRLVHEYFVVDMGLAWIMAKNDVPNLKEKIALIMRSDYDVRQKKLLK